MCIVETRVGPTKDSSDGERCDLHGRLHPGTVLRTNVETGEMEGTLTQAVGAQQATGPLIQLGQGMEPQGTSAINPQAPTALTGSYQGLLKMQI